MALLIDRFNVIEKYTEDNITFNDWISNYLNNNILCHYLLIVNKFDNSELEYNIKNYLRNIKNILCRNNKSYIKSNIDNIISITNDYCKLINKLKVLFNIEKCDNMYLLFNNIIIENPIIKSIINKEFLINSDKVINLINVLPTTTSQNTIIKYLEECITSNFPIDEDYNNNYNEIINFKKTCDYIIILNQKYKTISSIDNEIFNDVKSIINNIFSNNDHTFIFNFIKIFNKELVFINKLSEIKNILLMINITNINQLLEYIDILNQMDIEYIDIIINKYINIMTDEDIIYITNLINTNIIKNINNNENYYKIVSKYNQIDFFLNLIETNLMKRIIYYNSDINKEKEEYMFLKKYFHKQHIYKYNKILSDYDKSLFDENIKKIYISNNIWKLNTIEGYYIDESNKLYLHLGFCEFKIKNKLKEFNVKGLPLHFYVLNTIKNNQSYDLFHYDKKLIMFIEEQLYYYNLIEYNNVGDFIINDYYNGDDISLLDESLNFMLLKDDNIIINNIKEELAHERKHIVMANINHFVKNNKNTSMDELYNNVVYSIKNLFLLDRDYFDSIYNIMVEKDYF